MSVKIDKALPADIDPIYHIIKSYSDDDVVLERSREEISASLETFLVAREGNKIEGVISYYDYGPDLKEVRSLCVSKENLRKGTGSLLLKNLIDEILRQNSRTKIFVLTYNPLFFMKNRFVEVEKNSLPEKIWKDCDSCKNRENCREIAMIYR
jgi:amino-acid N-acetyltransferase